jgi:hypothetical protein
MINLLCLAKIALESPTFAHKILLFEIITLTKVVPLKEALISEQVS